MHRSASVKAKKKLIAKFVAGIGGIAAAALSLANSIYETRIAQEVPQADIGVTIDAGRWNVTLNSATVTQQLPNGLQASAGKKALAVQLTLENLSAESSNLYHTTLQLENIQSPTLPQFYLLRDRDILWSLQPMLKEQVTAVWQIPKEQELPSALKISVIGDTFKPEDNLYAAPSWFSSGLVAQVKLPLADMRSVSP